MNFNVPLSVLSWKKQPEVPISYGVLCSAFTKRTLHESVNWNVTLRCPLVVTVRNCATIISDVNILITNSIITDKTFHVKTVFLLEGQPLGETKRDCLLPSGGHRQELQKLMKYQVRLMGSYNFQSRLSNKVYIRMTKKKRLLRTKWLFRV